MKYLCSFSFLVAACAPPLALAGGDVVVQVVDEASAPVFDASVRVGFFGPRDGLTPSFLGVSGATDRMGRFVTQRKGDAVSGISIHKSGYYESRNQTGGFVYSYNFILKRIGDAVPLFVKTVEFSRTLPAGGTARYDFEIGDWCPPYGKGIKSDVVFSRQGSFVDNAKPFDVTFTISFAEVDDGIQEAAFDETSGSILRLPREAPVDGYVSSIQRRIYRTDETGTIGGGHRINRGYFIRVRSVRTGGLVVANYVKILGDFYLRPDGSFQFNYYFNPRRGEKNLEWDMKNNLFKGLRRDEFVSEP